MKKQPLNDAHLLVGICGSIAAYKSAYLVRELIKAGAHVKIVMTEAATDFVGPLTFATLSKNPVYYKFYNRADGTWNNHVELAQWADAFLIAPASANTITKMTHGYCDNLLMAVYLSATCPIFLAPAMDRDMYQHTTTLSNLEQLKRRGHTIIPTEKGVLASGLTGFGRMAEPNTILKTVRDHWETPEKNYQFFTKKQKKKLRGKKALVTAGPTYEPIDAVRFIGNHSSGKMGFALAEVLAASGVKVTLVTGPTHLNIHHPNVECFDVETAEEMYETCMAHFPEVDIAILAAAVADFTITDVKKGKIKKADAPDILQLSRTKDILAMLGQKKKKNQILVGFALEEEKNGVKNAHKKCKDKQLDFIVLNSLDEKETGFQVDTNKVSFVDRAGKVKDFPLKPKIAVAQDIIRKIVDIL